jgi:hypothetical protein
MPKKKTAAELQAENKALKNYHISDAISNVLVRVVQWGGIVFCCRYAYLTIAALAGKYTIADIGIGVLGNVRISEGLAWMLAIGFGAYGVGQGKLRRDTIERLQGRIKELEKELDAGRSSSNLTTRGTTRPEDKP